MMISSKLIKKIFGIIFISISLTCCNETKYNTKPKQHIINQEIKLEEKLNKEEIIKVALLLPLSGDYKHIGNSLLDAATLAIENNKNKNILLSYFDTEEAPFAARNAALKAAKDGVDIIVGPLLSKDVKEILPIVKQHNIKTLTFSNNRQLAAEGVYVFGFTVEDQIRRILEYCIVNNYSDFYVALPKGFSGSIAAQEVKSILMSNNLAFNKLEFYDHTKDESIKMAASSISIAIKNSTAPDNKKVLFVADDLGNLAKIVGELGNQGLDSSKIKLISTGQIEGNNNSYLQFLDGLWFAGARNDQSVIFEYLFKDQFSYKPARIATLAYDAISLIARTGLKEENIYHDSGFVGVDGTFKFNVNKIVERKLSIIAVHSGEFQIISN